MYVSLFLCMSPIPACQPGIPDTCVKCVRAGRAWQVGNCNPTRECTVADVGCYQTEELCLKWGEQQKAKETCKKQQRCSDCMRADNYCGWWRKTGVCFMIADVWWDKEGELIKSGQVDECDNALTSKPIISSACSKCGTIKQSGIRSCCAPGGAWSKNCGDPGDSNFDHTWLEGLQACKGTLTTS